MKAKIVAGIALFSISLPAAFAMDIHNGKLLSHRQWTTGNVVKAEYTQAASKHKSKLPTLLKENGNNNAGDDVIEPRFYHVDVDGTLNDAGGVFTGDDLILTGHGELYIANNTSSSQRYKITHQLCASGDCVGVEDQIELGIGGWTSVDNGVRMPVNYDSSHIGEYIDVFFTLDLAKLNKDSSTTKFKTFAWHEFVVKDSHDKPNNNQS